jgi:hypothetical protein
VYTAEVYTDKNTRECGIMEVPKRRAAEKNVETAMMESSEVE